VGGKGMAQHVRGNPHRAGQSRRNRSFFDLK
jgi:hypothetical protein